MKWTNSYRSFGLKTKRSTGLKTIEHKHIKAQIARKEEEIDQLRQTVAGLRRRLEELEDDGRERNQAG